MKTIIFTFILLVSTICQATFVNLTWSNSETTSYCPSYSTWESIQSYCSGWLVEVVEYENQYTLLDSENNSGNVLASGTIRPNSSAPFRNFSIIADIPEGTKIYLRLHNSGEMCYANLGTADGEPYYTVKSYEDSVNFESISREITFVAGRHGIWTSEGATYDTYIIQKGEHINGDIMGFLYWNVAPILDGTTTNGWELAYGNTSFYPVPDDNYAFTGWIGGAWGNDNPLTVYSDMAPSDIGATFTSIPTNFYVTSEFVSTSTNLELNINFESKENFNYHVEYTDSLASNTIWQTCSTNMTAIGSNTVWSLCVDPSVTSRYYRVVQENP